MATLWTHCEPVSIGLLRTGFQRFLVATAIFRRHSRLQTPVTVTSLQPHRSPRHHSAGRTMHTIYLALHIFGNIHCLTQLEHLPSEPLRTVQNGTSPYALSLRSPRSSPTQSLTPPSHVQGAHRAVRGLSVQRPRHAHLDGDGEIHVVNRNTVIYMERLGK